MQMEMEMEREMGRSLGEGDSAINEFRTATK